MGVMPKPFASDDNRGNRESMEMLTKRKVELIKVAKSTVRGKDTQITITDFGDEEPSSDVNSAENLRVEWSTKHL
nr:zinc finger protein 830-like isoform X2 [Ipomoea batatas]